MFVALGESETLAKIMPRKKEVTEDREASPHSGTLAAQRNVFGDEQLQKSIKNRVKKKKKKIYWAVVACL